MLYIGIDIHKHSHEICILDEIGKPCGQTFKISNSHPGVAELLERIQRVNREQQPLRFGMEATGHYWMSLHHVLTQAGYEVTVLNPARTSAYRKLRIRPVKTDRIDARCIAEIIRHEVASSPYLIDETIWALRQMTRLRIELADQMAIQKRRIIALMDRVFPEYMPLFAGRFGKGSCALLSTYPTPRAILQLTLDELTDFLTRATKGKLGHARAEAVMGAAQSSFGMNAGDEGIGFQVILLTQGVLFLQQQLEALERKIQELVNQLPQQLTSITGIGEILAATLLGEIGDIRRFKHGKALVAYAGIDPRVFQSGQFNAQRVHISKRGSPYLRRAIWLAATAAKRWDPALKALFERKLSEGKAYHVAMGAVANKLVHIIYAVLRDNRPYRSAPSQPVVG